MTTDGLPLPPLRQGPHPLAGAGRAPVGRSGARHVPGAAVARDGRRSGLPGLRLLCRLRVPTRRLFKCKGCGKQFSVTSGTTFHGRKLPIRDYLMAIAIFANAAKGISALQLGRDLDVSYKTAFVLAHKLREAMAADQAKYQPKGHVEIDGAYFGGHRKPANFKANRVDRRLAEHQTGKRRVVVVMRERQGRTLPFVVRAEDDGVAVVARRVARLDRLRRRGGLLGCPACPLRHQADQPQRRVLGRRRLHQSGRELLLAPAPGRVRPAPPHQRRLPRASTPARWRGARTCAARPTATSTSA